MHTGTHLLPGSDRKGVDNLLRLPLKCAPATALLPCAAHPFAASSVPLAASLPRLAAALAAHALPSRRARPVQPADEKLGMVNIRSDDDATPESVLAGMSAEDEAFVLGMRRDGQIYERLAASLAPGVFGHLDVKKAILLMLLGGVHKQTAEARTRCALAAPRCCVQSPGCALGRG